MPLTNRVKNQNKQRKIPETLRAYEFHGLQLQWQEGDRDAIGECPFCARERKFQVNIQSGVSRCLVCNTGNHSGGLNAASFCAKLWEESRKDVGELAKQRHIDPEVLELWEVRKSLTRNDWLIPGYNQSGKISNVYSYRRMKSGWRVIPTPTLGHQLFGMHLWKSTKNIVFICEGPWDSMALWDILSRTTVVGEELGYSKDPEDLLTNDINVVGVPGSNTFLDAWLPLFRNKTVNIVFDNDHPKLNTKTGRMMKPAGLTGTRRLAGIVGEVAEEVNYLNWGPEGYDKNYKDGLDIRDMLTLSDERIKSA